MRFRRSANLTGRRAKPTTAIRRRCDEPTCGGPFSVESTRSRKRFCTTRCSERWHERERKARRGY